MEDAECLLAEEQVGGDQKLWSSNNHYTLRQITSRNVRKFNTTTTDYTLSLNVQFEEQPLLDQLGNIFDSLVDKMTTGMADNDLVRFVLQSLSTTLFPFPSCQRGLWAKCNVSYNPTNNSVFKFRFQII